MSRCSACEANTWNQGISITVWYFLIIFTSSIDRLRVGQLIPQPGTQCVRNWISWNVDYLTPFLRPQLSFPIFFFHPFVFWICRTLDPVSLSLADGVNSLAAFRYNPCYRYVSSPRIFFNIQIPSSFRKQSVTGPSSRTPILFTVFYSPVSRNVSRNGASYLLVKVPIKKDRCSREPRHFNKSRGSTNRHTYFLIGTLVSRSIAGE